ncbi:cyclic nucleotide-binding domain-containing protein [Epilithonimonas ginsengisoli]|uniref:Cyclic nucleotide-binding domain-containing protein n=1 Tax=Epilithonimonas ginsengisoli TaxID=1245592 RepID=A0ABU4JE92_9FLAO|nr:MULTISPECIES: cyclic nucleotide-binding domain-containing protein [Chryseobacterium group]MBV6879315.1 cyclic nucleotide-binding domain-containing protein [Epilithonimonas sp. FP105]MDW8547988.1 cyclic nucleotide-binding domain-containing protein [Epilithonimonas ginsengisoli]OAH73092.1 hypothetical protein AXA65_08460 [Chryseobacterium sp. FP211-J200]
MEESAKEFLLQNIPGITREDIEILSPYTTLRTFKSGEIYIRPGENNRKVYFIKSGIVRVYHLEANGTEKTILFHNKKSFSEIMMGSFTTSHRDTFINPLVKPNFLN